MYLQKYLENFCLSSDSRTSGVFSAVPQYLFSFPTAKYILEKEDMCVKGKNKELCAANIVGLTTNQFCQFHYVTSERVSSH